MLEMSQRRAVALQIVLSVSGSHGGNEAVEQDPGMAKEGITTAVLFHWISGILRHKRSHPYAPLRILGLSTRYWIPSKAASSGVGIR